MILAEKIAWKVHINQWLYPLIQHVWFYHIYYNWLNFKFFCFSWTNIEYYSKYNGYWDRLVMAISRIFLIKEVENRLPKLTVFMIDKPNSFKCHTLGTIVVECLNSEA